MKKSIIEKGNLWTTSATLSPRKSYEATYVVLRYCTDMQGIDWIVAASVIVKHEGAVRVGYYYLEGTINRVLLSRGYCY